MPLHGYTRMFENMLDHPNIKVMLNTDYREIRNMVPYREMVYTGPVDEFFDYRFGKLPYRSLEFKHETHDRAGVPAGAGRQLPERACRTRASPSSSTSPASSTRRPASFTSSRAPRAIRTTRSRGRRTRRSTRSTRRWRTQRPDVHFVGRLATYKYYNMDQVVAQALSLVGKMAGTKTRADVMRQDRPVAELSA